MLHIGIDVGSTTVKVVAIGAEQRLVFRRYARHNARARDVVSGFLRELMAEQGNQDTKICLTGSVGMGIAEQKSLCFVQEVVAATKAISRRYHACQAMIDIGGEDAKVVFFRNSAASDLRMNGNCAGGTGAFIDQMAMLLDVSTAEMDTLAAQSSQLFPIASRCGVFSKTDVQNLIARNVSREDIAASIFHAVVVQTVTTLAHGCDIVPPVLLCGGPLTFLPSLRRAFLDYLNLSERDIILPEHGELLSAMGAAYQSEDEGTQIMLKDLCNLIEKEEKRVDNQQDKDSRRLFKDEAEYAKWRAESMRTVERTELKAGTEDAFIGIDSGSTTTKIVVINRAGQLLFTYYSGNGGNPIAAVERGLCELRDECLRRNATLNVIGSCSTGYGEDLIKQAFQLHFSIVETIAHYLSARRFDPKVSFILDIGGQDMKAIFVNDGVIDRIDINEACSSGCGSFIETFAKTLGYGTTDFAKAACRAQNPCDLGTRCTVFMNSKVKQVLREGAGIEDISAGLAFSVVRNCLYKVLKLKDVHALGKHIVVQGGTMKNDAVVRALELLTGTKVTRSDIPQLMGALGCALFARENASTPITIDEMIDKASYTTTHLHCKGCENKCLVARYSFGSGKRFYSGNRCEKVFNNGGKNALRGTNIYKEKYRLLFDRTSKTSESRMRIGIPRVLNMYEEYPFWHTLLTECGIDVVLSDESEFANYEQTAKKVMSDNICFPAKLVHSHIKNLQEKAVQRILMPFVVFEKAQNEQNSFNCPIVTGYSEVVKSVQDDGVPIDSPVVSFKQTDLLIKQCEAYLSTLGIDKHTAKRATKRALDALNEYNRNVERLCDEVISGQTSSQNGLTILLAGRPYHTDPLIQHKVSDMIAGMGINVITDDVVRSKDVMLTDSHYVSQWSYPNRILKAAKWCAHQGQNVQFVQLTSFGCGPDAFLIDIVNDMLMRHGKTLTILKLDDICNVGSMKLRVRSLIESLRIANNDRRRQSNDDDFPQLPPFDEAHKHRKILIPFFTPYISPLLPSLCRYAGFDAEALPISNKESGEMGLRYANNEVCYPATLIVGDIVKAFKSGRYDPHQCAVAISQTGGQCRASNYISLIKKALLDAGYDDVPVISLTFDSNFDNNQPAFRVNWAKMMPVAIRAVLFSDAICKMHHVAEVRENAKGAADKLKNKYLTIASNMIETSRSSQLYDCLRQAVGEFKRIITDKECPRVGVVGEIFLKFNPFAQRNIGDWLRQRGIEIVSPALTPFFTQAFVNRLIYDKEHVERKSGPQILFDAAYKYIRSKIEKVNRICADFPHYLPIGDIFEEAKEAQKFISLSAQFGEGWLLPAEIASYNRSGIHNVVSLQPFGCIANHIVARGIERRIHKLLPDMNLLALDFDSSVSEVNITNRMLLFIENLNKEQQ